PCKGRIEGRLALAKQGSRNVHGGPPEWPGGDHDKVRHPSSSEKKEKKRATTKDTEDTKKRQKKQRGRRGRQVSCSGIPPCPLLLLLFFCLFSCLPCLSWLLSSGSLLVTGQAGHVVVVGAEEVLQGPVGRLVTRHGAGEGQAVL